MRTFRVPSTDGVVLEVQVHEPEPEPPSSPAGGVQGAVQVSGGEHSAGERPAASTVLLAHANGFHGRVFDPAVEALMRAGRSAGIARVVTFDFRAHGGSTSPALSREDTMAAPIPGEASTSDSSLPGGSDGRSDRSVALSEWENRASSFRRRLRWATFAEDVLAVVSGLRLEGCVAVGHSLGAHALLRAASIRPGTFASVYCFEPIFVVPRSRLPPGAAPANLEKGAARRRRSFASKAAAHAALGSKPPLSAVHPAAMRAYVEHGFLFDGDSESYGSTSQSRDGTWHSGKVHLACAPEAEAAIFANGGEEHTALAEVSGAGGTTPGLEAITPRRRGVGCPITVAHGALTDPRQPGVVLYSSAIAPVIAADLGGGAALEHLPQLDHFGPLVDPEAFAASVLRHWVRHHGGGVGRERSRL